MPEAFPALVLFTLVATATPGGATTLATASGIQHGFRRSLPLLLGIALGLASLAAAAASGLAALLKGLPTLELSLKLAGTGYLLWLAYRIGSAGAPGATPDDQAARPISFGGGMVLLWLNPKAWAMALGAAASFAAVAKDPVDLALIMGATFGFAAIGSLSLWCVGGVVFARLLRSERQWRVVNAVLALLLAGSIVTIWLG